MLHKISNPCLSSLWIILLFAYTLLISKFKCPSICTNLRERVERNARTSKSSSSIGKQSIQFTKNNSQITARTKFRLSNDNTLQYQYK